MRPEEPVRSMQALDAARSTVTGGIADILAQEGDQ